ncbi:kinetochore protein SLK19-like [Nicotiana sylvestris]|uniref:kinetochore protein SLK19-like n=1 Tax=Nicotiana sylvestris TaxID=4096 RepID=UPI00388CE4B7
MVEERDVLKRLYVQKEGEAQQKGELVEQLRKEVMINEVETLGWKKHIDRLASKKDTLWEQLTSIEQQLQNTKEESLARSRKIEELEAKSVAELVKAKFEAEAIVSSYRADTKASNIQAHEISIVADEEASALISNDEDSASGSKSGGDEDEVPEQEIFEDATPEDVASKDVVPETFDKLKSKLLCYEARLRKALDEERSLRLLYDEKEFELVHLQYEKKTEALERLQDEVGRARRKHDELKTWAEAQVVVGKDALAKVLDFEA